jgi:NADH:ubiquinone oxidoreductase subunit E
MSPETTESKFDFVCVCTGKDCCKHGAKKILKGYKDIKHLPGSSKRLKVVKMKCLDYCKKAPVVILQNRIVFYAENPEH